MIVELSSGLRVKSLARQHGICIASLLMADRIFVTALELKPSHPQLLEKNPSLIPIFLAWCLLACNGFNSQFASVRFSPDVVLDYCVQAKPQVRQILLQLISRLLTSTNYLEAKVTEVLHSAFYKSFKGREISQFLLFAKHVILH